MWKKGAAYTHNQTHRGLTNEIPVQTLSSKNTDLPLAASDKQGFGQYVQKVIYYITNYFSRNVMALQLLITFFRR